MLIGKLDPPKRLAKFAARFWGQPDLPAWLRDCRRVVVGVSGGADSMVLLWLMAGAPGRPAWAPEVVAGHVHHGLRGADADADQAAAAKLAAALGVPAIGLYGASNPAQLKPYGAASQVFYKGIGCSPCGIKPGCKSNECMKLIGIDEVFEGAGRALT